MYYGCTIFFFGVLLYDYNTFSIFLYYVWWTSLYAWQYDDSKLRYDGAYTLILRHIVTVQISYKHVQRIGACMHREKFVAENQKITFHDEIFEIKLFRNFFSSFFSVPSAARVEELFLFFNIMKINGIFLVTLFDVCIRGFWWRLFCTFFVEMGCKKDVELKVLSCCITILSYLQFPLL